MHSSTLSAFSFSIDEFARVSKSVRKDRFCFLLLLGLNVALSFVYSTEGCSSLGRERSSEEEESTECLESQEESRVDMSSELVHVDFEVYGTVQGVFFRKYTQKEATKLGLRGYCRNTSSGTVQGSLEGSRQAIEQMKTWLQNTGSPMSRISKADFKNEKKIESYTFGAAFDIAKST